MIRAFRQRFYPTDDQESMLAGYFGSVRFVWNVLLEMISRAYAERSERMTYVDVAKQITILKRAPEFAWMND